MQLEVISRQPGSPTRAAPLLFVHGAWHGAWCWDEHFLDYFAEQGFAAYALSLRGHGKSDGHATLRWARLSQYVADVAEVAGQLPSAPVVIGHSMGGGVVQKYLETHSAPAGVLLASMPPSGVFPTVLRTLRRNPLGMLKVNLTLSLYPLVSTPQLARYNFFSADMPEHLVRAYHARLQDEAYVGFLGMLALELPNPRRVTTPLLVLGASNDTIFHPREVEATARAYNTRATIFPDMAHDMMLEAGWRSVAEHIDGWLKERQI